MLVVSSLIWRWPLLLYAVSWTLVLTVTVVFASFAPELAFVSVVSLDSSFSKACRTAGAIRVPIDTPGEVVCLPAKLFGRSKVDLVVPPVFAAVVVVGSAWIVRALGLFEVDDDEAF